MQKTNENTITQSLPAPIGIIEGFYGKHWPQEDRRALAPYFAEMGVSFYIYAPKSDAWLRSAWREPFPANRLQQLDRLSATYQKHAMGFGVGLSPMEIWRDWGPRARTDLTQKIKALEAINPTMLCILLDDMRGDTNELARIQSEIMDFVASLTTILKLSFCPTYYSTDPILDTLFGERPKDYLHSLGEHIPKTIDIFWTGPKVISPTVPDGHLETITNTIGRKPLLWDNAFANDGRRSSNYVYTAPPQGYAPATLNKTAGLVFNPMNQPWVSRLCIHKLLRDTIAPGMSPSPVYNIKMPTALEALFTKHRDALQINGLNTLTPSQIASLKADFYPFSKHPEVKEIVDWLDAEYLFDPVCLTDSIP